MHIGCEIVQGSMTNRAFHSLASIESERLVDERMILFRQMGESPDPSCIFGKDCAIRQVSRGATGVQNKRDGIVERITRCGLHGFNERISKSAFWYSGNGLRARFPVQTDAMQIGRAHVWNSSHANISYAVFCLKKKKKKYIKQQ